MRRFVIAAMWAVAGYLAGAFGGGFLISTFSSNQFDRSIEAAMTGAFVTGPLGALTAFIVGLIRSGRKQPLAASRGSGQPPGPPSSFLL